MNVLRGLRVPRTPWSRQGVIALSIAVATIALRGDGMRLADAVRAGDREAVRALLRAKVDVNAAAPDGTTPLHLAAQANDLDTTKLLLAAGANARAANRYGSTPVIVAATNGNAAIVEALLDAGADPNTTATRGQTVLMTAARTGNVQAVEVLLDRGADLARREELLGENALMWAAAEDHADVVTLLLSRGADPNARSKALTFPKDRFGLEGVLTFLPPGRWTALMYAAREGAAHAADVLAGGGADLDTTDPEGATALLRAIMNAHYDTAAVLIGHRADPDVADVAGMTPLYATVDMNSLGEVYGRPPRRVNDRHSALDIERLLLERGANPNAQLKTPTLTRAHTPGDPVLGEGATALMRAAKHGDYRSMQMLLDHGADVSLKQKNGATALMLAAGLGRGQSAFSEDVGTEADLFKAAQLAVMHGADVTGVHDSGNTPLHYAAQSGLNSVVTLLVEHGAVLDAMDKQGRTPADAALGVGSRGRAGGPPIVHQGTAALIKRLLAEKTR